MKVKARLIDVIASRVARCERETGQGKKSDWHQHIPSFWCAFFPPTHGKKALLTAFTVSDSVIGKSFISPLGKQSRTELITYLSL